MQYAVPDLKGLLIDQAALARRRDRLTTALSRAGFKVVPPEGTFYLLSRWPEGDPEALWKPTRTSSSCPAASWARLSICAPGA